MSTNFHPLPSGGFIASQPKPCYTLSRLPTLLNDISGRGFYQGIFALDKIVFLCQYYSQHNLKRHPQPSQMRNFYAYFMALYLWSKVSLKGTRLLKIANHPVTVRSGRTLGRASGWLSFFADLANLRRCPMASKQNGFRPGSKPNWRKLFASITRYLEEFHSRNQHRGSK